MGKKKEDKKRKKTESALESLISEKDLNNSEILADIIAVLKKFCDDNILALRPLLEEVEDNDAIKERIIHFITLSDILDTIPSEVEIRTRGIIIPVIKFPMKVITNNIIG